MVTGSPSGVGADRQEVLLGARQGGLAGIAALLHRSAQAEHAQAKGHVDHGAALFHLLTQRAQRGIFDQRLVDPGVHPALGLGARRLGATVHGGQRQGAQLVGAAVDGGVVTVAHLLVRGEVQHEEAIQQSLGLAGLLAVFQQVGAQLLQGPGEVTDRAHRFQVGERAGKVTARAPGPHQGGDQILIVRKASPQGGQGRQLQPLERRRSPARQGRSRLCARRFEARGCVGRILGRHWSGARQPGLDLRGEGQEQGGALGNRAQRLAGKPQTVGRLAHRLLHEGVGRPALPQQLVGQRGAHLVLDGGERRRRALVAAPRGRAEPQGALGGARSGGLHRRHEPTYQRRDAIEHDVGAGLRRQAAQPRQQAQRLGHAPRGRGAHHVDHRQGSLGQGRVVDLAPTILAIDQRLELGEATIALLDRQRTRRRPQRRHLVLHPAVRAGEVGDRAEQQKERHEGRHPPPAAAPGERPAASVRRGPRASPGDGARRPGQRLRRVVVEGRRRADCQRGFAAALMIPGALEVHEGRQVALPRHPQLLPLGVRRHRERRQQQRRGRHPVTRGVQQCRHRSDQLGQQSAIGRRQGGRGGHGGAHDVAQLPDAIAKRDPVVTTVVGPQLVAVESLTYGLQRWLALVLRHVSSLTRIAESSSFVASGRFDDGQEIRYLPSSVFFWQAASGQVAPFFVPSEDDADVDQVSVSPDGRTVVAQIDKGSGAARTHDLYLLSVGGPPSV